jgi:hypothetical protein
MVLLVKRRSERADLASFVFVLPSSSFVFAFFVFVFLC